MKTYSQVQAERAAVAEAAATEKRLSQERNLKLLQELETRTIAVQPCHASSRERCREAIRSGVAEESNVACDHCGTTLFSVTPQVMYLANWGSHEVVCPGCGWSGWL